MMEDIGYFLLRAICLLAIAAGVLGAGIVCAGLWRVFWWVLA